MAISLVSYDDLVFNIQYCFIGINPGGVLERWYSTPLPCRQLFSLVSHTHPSPELSPAAPPTARVYNVKAHRDMRPSAFLYINSQLDQTIDYEEGEAVRTFKWFSEEKIKSTA